MGRDVFIAGGAFLHTQTQAKLLHSVDFQIPLGRVSLPRSDATPFGLTKLF